MFSFHKASCQTATRTERQKYSKFHVFECVEENKPSIPHNSTLFFPFEKKGIKTML